MENYRVDINSVPPKVIDDNGNEIKGAHVRAIDFPHERIKTYEGPTWVISGPGEATIIVDGRTIYGIPLA